MDRLRERERESYSRAAAAAAAGAAAATVLTDRRRNEATRRVIDCPHDVERHRTFPSPRPPDICPPGRLRITEPTQTRALDLSAGIQGPDLQNILRQSYDYLTIMPKLRSTYDGRLIYKNILRRAQCFSLANL